MIDKSKIWIPNRRQLLAGSVVTAAAGILSRPNSAQAANIMSGKLVKQLDATASGGIDLYVESKKWRINGIETEAITINGSMPGPLIRMQEGKDALIRVHNRMRESTSIHWHGILLPFTMDGVPGVSFPGIEPGATFTYRYPVRQNGTYWYHSHSGFQEQMGHFGQLIIDPLQPDPVDFDVEYSVLLSDWTYGNPHRIMRKLKTMPGYSNFQRPTLANIRDQRESSGKSFGEVIRNRLAWQKMRMDPTDIADVTGAIYTYLINGKSAQENPTFVAKQGERVRLRIVNAAAMTYFDFRIPGIEMSIVQADGQNIQPVTTDEFRIGVAESYDVIVSLPDNQPYTLFAETADRSGFVCGTLAPSVGMSAAIPERRNRPMLTMSDMGMSDMGDMEGAGMTQSMNNMGEMNGMKAGSVSNKHIAGHASSSPNRANQTQLPVSNLPDSVVHGNDWHGQTNFSKLQSANRRLDYPGAGLGGDGWRVLTYSQLRALKRPSGRKPPTRQIDLHLTGNMEKYIWGFDGKKWSEAKPIRFVYGERLRINFINDTMMTHPLHLHGMWMDLYAGGDLETNPRKHTVNVQPAELVTVDISVDAPGQWAFHCHLIYHMDAGMFRTVAVVKSLESEPTHAAAK